MEKNQIPELIRKGVPSRIIEEARKLESRGFTAYIVGGAVRDMLLGKTPKDWDLATNALPEQICDIFGVDKEEKSLKTGSFVIETNELQFEITSQRAESEYGDRRHPDKVSFGVDIKEDLRRRDFTVNAMAVDLLTWEFIDPFRGFEDFNRKIINCVGNPRVRFSEDPLRMLRAMRLMGELGFKIDDDCIDFIRNNTGLIEFIPRVKLRDELERILLSEYAKEVASEFTGVMLKIASIITNSANVRDGYSNESGAERERKCESYIKNADEKSLQKTCEIRFSRSERYDEVILQNANAIALSERNFTERLLIIYFGIIDFADDDLHRNLVISLFLTREERKKLQDIARVLHETMKADRVSLKRQLRDYGYETLKTAIGVRLAFALAILSEVGDMIKSNGGRADCVNEYGDLLAKSKKAEVATFEIRQSQKIIDDIIQSGECYSISGLKITGRDLVRIGFRGPQIGEVLSELLELVIIGKIENAEGVLLRKAENLKVMENI